ncbi:MULTISPECIES: Rv3654c family TadE-like protein [Mycobacterium]|uniref:Helicase n=1 Tax=Mycobacterium colombiense TaxID=339268 RepID=A0A329L7T4_9MYCO|nr:MULTISPECIES: Rv3654c family TadE-like protein [Mycobacterium]MDM4140218.1 flp pilus-assembly TadE/G-like family protein [Mycobacterium sp. FLAC0960]RAV03406.1 helicase [Mycobacterium colombiense]
MVAAWMIVVLLTVTGAAAYLGSAVVARHRAQAVADLAALAAANRLSSGAGTACADATMVARRMWVNDIGCVIDGLDVVVTARVALAFGGAAKAAARTGPATGND